MENLKVSDLESYLNTLFPMMKKFVVEVCQPRPNPLCVLFILMFMFVEAGRRHKLGPLYHQSTQEVDRSSYHLPIEICYGCPTNALS